MAACYYNGGFAKRAPGAVHSRGDYVLIRAIKDREVTLYGDGRNPPKLASVKQAYKHLAKESVADPPSSRQIRLTVRFVFAALTGSAPPPGSAPPAVLIGRPRTDHIRIRTSDAPFTATVGLQHVTKSRYISREYFCCITVVLNPLLTAQVHILSLLEHIKQQQDQLVAKVNHLSSRVLNTSTAQEPECPECIQLPIESLEAVDELEAFLKDAANAAAKQRMISSLATIGGQDVKRVAWNILSRMFTEEVAKTISWKGANGKRAFGAVRANGLCRTATATDIQRYAIRWFNLAADRGAARRRLTNRSNQAEAED
ncbi:unnamed protein product [Leuciscus chuanchicus]